MKALDLLSEAMVSRVDARRCDGGRRFVLGHYGQLREGAPGGLGVIGERGLLLLAQPARHPHDGVAVREGAVELQLPLQQVADGPVVWGLAQLLLVLGHRQAHGLHLVFHQPDCRYIGRRR